MANPTKTSYINKGRQLATQLTQALAAADAYNEDMNKLGFVSGGADAITQEDLDAAVANQYPGSPAGSFTLEHWDGGVYAIGKNAQDYRGGEDAGLLPIAF